MKLFILFTLFCGIFAQTDETENTKIPTYTTNHTYIPNCKVYNTDANGIESTCQSCQEGFTLANSNTKCNQIIPTAPYPNPITVSGGQIVHPEIGYDTKENKCEKRIKIVNAQGNEDVPEDKYYGNEKSCLACAQYSTEKDGDYTKCLVCADGYLENNGKCTPIVAETFNDENTFKHCLHGKYESGNAKCKGCETGYKLDDNGKCIPASNIGKLQGCARADHIVLDNNIFNCTSCSEGYSLYVAQKLSNELPIYQCVKSSSTTAQYCLASNQDGTCTKCMSGYRLVSGECNACEFLVPQTNFFEKDECNMMNYAYCDCNPNCVLANNYLSCESRHCDLFSETEMSTKYAKNPKCLRCEQGYMLVEVDVTVTESGQQVTKKDLQCQKCTNDCFTSSDKKKCLPGYYLATGSDGSTACRKCKGKCKKCISETQCVEDELENSSHYGYALNGLPCFDSNCKLCSSEDPKVCYKCDNEDFSLIGGKCYKKAMKDFSIQGITEPFYACRYYEDPNFVTNSTVQPDFSVIQFSELEHAYLRDDVNKIGVEYYCKYYDDLPIYYKYHNNKIECVGENRDPNNDCECLPEHYPENIHKYSKCIKTEVKYCSKPISKDICAKCYEGMVLLNEGTKRKPKYVCGCPETDMRINSHDVCVKCPKNCATCKTVYTNEKTKEGPKTVCLSCRGEYQFSSEAKDLQANDYYRNVSNLCECRDGYKSYTDSDKKPASDNTIYSCYEVPRGCKGDKKHDVAPYSVTCTKCDKTGFTVDSSCQSCENAHYGKVNSETNLIESCTICPEIEKGKGVTYCSSCVTDTECSECIAENLNVTNNCKTCNDGYTLKYRNKNEGEPYEKMPICVQCQHYCNLDGNLGCFYGEENMNDTTYNSYKDKEIYTSEELNKGYYHPPGSRYRSRQPRRYHSHPGCGDPYGPHTRSGDPTQHHRTGTKHYRYSDTSHTVV